MTDTKLYWIWAAMLDRCRNPNNKRYSDWGGRGIQVCEEWHRFEPFLSWALSHGYEEGLQIDREDNDGNYEPNNCRFTTQVVNVNNARKNRRLTIFGETKTVAQWGRDSRCAVPTYVLRDRLRLGWSLELAVQIPVTPGKHYQTWLGPAHV